MFNSKYWNVPQNRDRYAVVGTRNKKNLSFTFPKEQHEFVPKLSDYLEKDVPEKYYLPDEKAQTIIAQAMEKLENDTRKIYADYYIDDKNMTIAQVESTINQIKEIMEEMTE